MITELTDITHLAEVLLADDWSDCRAKWEANLLFS
jgi:hypothetical protein